MIVVELVNAVNPEPTSVEAFRARLERVVPGRVSYAAVAIDEVGVIGGYLSVLRHPWLPEGHFWARVIVDPALRRRGVGELLYQHTLDFLRMQPATHLLSEARATCPEGLEFARHRGFAVQRHMFVSLLYLAEFDPAPFVGIVEGAEATGIRFITLTDVAATTENRRKLYELHRACAVDNPAYEGWSFPDFETFCRQTFESPRYRPDTHLLAVDGERWIGLASLDYYPEQRAIHNGFTGVDRAYRGRRQALALKLLSIQVARRYAVEYLYTNNDSTNAPMLAVSGDQEHVYGLSGVDHGWRTYTCADAAPLRSGISHQSRQRRASRSRP